MEKSNDGRVYGYAEVLALLGGTNEALTEPYRLTAAGITFEPDPAVWRTLTDEERLEIGPAGWTPGEPILAFPFSAAELLRFVENSALPALARWCEQDENDPAAFSCLESHPLARDLAMFLTGVSAAVEPEVPPPVEAPPVSDAVKRTRRRDLLAPVIEAAKREAHNPGDVAEVFAMLQAWARMPERRPPLDGVTESGVKWLDAQDQMKELTRDALAKRLRRRPSRR